MRVVYARARGPRRGPMRNLRAGPLPLRYGQIYIVALAQIRPPHCTISCLASRSAIIFPMEMKQWSSRTQRRTQRSTLTCMEEGSLLCVRYSLLATVLVAVYHMVINRVEKHDRKKPSNFSVKPIRTEGCRVSWKMHEMMVQNPPHDIQIIDLQPSFR